MMLRNDDEMANTQRKLQDIEKLIEQTRNGPASGRETELRSLTRLANQLREELIRYDAGRSARRAG